MTWHQLCGWESLTTRWRPLETSYVRPQASGHRGDVRWLEVFDPQGQGLRIERVEGSWGFSASKWSPHEAEVPHAFELPPSTATHLHLDFAQHGIGSRAGGPDVRPESQLHPREITAKFRLSVIGT